MAVAINWQLLLGGTKWSSKTRQEFTETSKSSFTVENGPAVGSNNNGSSSNSESYQDVEHSIACLAYLGQIEASWFAEGGSS